MISGFVSGELPAEDLQRATDHLSGCAACRERVEQARRDFDFLGSTTSRSDRSGKSYETAVLPTIEGYQMLSRIHGGSQGVVYKAVQKSTNRTVAVKVLLHELTGHATDRQKHRFEREINLARYDWPLFWP